LKLKICKTSIKAQKRGKKWFGNISKEKRARYRNVKIIKPNYLSTELRIKAVLLEWELSSAY
jgi:hypothetical protein